MAKKGVHKSKTNIILETTCNNIKADVSILSQFSKLLANYFYGIY